MGNQREALSGDEQKKKILKMDSQRLNEYLNKVMLENPVIEIEENIMGLTDGDMEERKKAWLDSSDFENGQVSYGEDGFPHDVVAEKEEPLSREEEKGSLQKHLQEQVHVLKLEERTTAAVEYCIACLDENGYLLASSQEFEEAGFTLEQTSKALEILQGLEPIGVGASDLEECLCLQLDEEDYLAQDIVKRFLKELGENKIGFIAQQLKFSEEEVVMASQRIRHLNPRPGSEYGRYERSQYVTPDVIMVQFIQEYYVILNEFSYPEIKISQEYLDMLAHVDDKETKQYIKQKMAEVKELVSCVAYRNQVLLDIAKAVIRRQKEFFLNGASHLQLLHMAELAEELNLEEETVRRAMKNKYLQCPSGVYPLRFFVVAEHTEQGKQIQGTEALRELISKLIEEEEKKEPYTDEGLSRLLEQKGYFISDEMVERYREEMNIPDSENRIFYRSHSDGKTSHDCCDGKCEH